MYLSRCGVTSMPLPRSSCCTDQCGPLALSNCFSLGFSLISLFQRRVDPCVCPFTTRQLAFPFLEKDESLTSLWDRALLRRVFACIHVSRTRVPSLYIRRGVKDSHVESHSPLTRECRDGQSRSSFLYKATKRILFLTLFLFLFIPSFLWTFLV